jgi:hypothetical protein
MTAFVAFLSMERQLQQLLMETQALLLASRTELSTFMIAQHSKNFRSYNIKKLSRYCGIISQEIFWLAVG